MAVAAATMTTTMTTAVIGATGRVGSEIVRGLLARGDAVTALVRDPGKARRAFGEPGGLPKIDVPVLVIQGDADRILPFEKTGKRLPGLIADMELVAVEGGPARHPLDPLRPGQQRPAGLPRPSGGLAGRAAGDLVGPQLAAHADRGRRFTAGPLGRRAMAVPERR